MKLYEDLRSAASGSRLYCVNCAQPNPAGNTTCDECGAEIPQPAPLFKNMFDVIVRPAQGMRRVAATAPLIQALLVIILASAIQYLSQTLSALQFWQKYYNSPSKVNEDFSKFNKDYVQLFSENKISSGAPTEVWSFLIFLVIAIIGAFLFAMAMQLVARLFYKNSVILHLNPLLSIVGFGRVAYLGSLVLVLITWLIPDASDVTSVLSLVPLVWQLTLLVFGVRASTGLNWNRAAVIVLTPALFFLYILPLLIGISLPI